MKLTEQQKEIAMLVVDFAKEPPRSVWVVSSPTGPDFVSIAKVSAMEHASECAGDFPELGPYRVCEYVAKDLATPPQPDDVRDAERYRWLAGEAESIQGRFIEWETNGGDYGERDETLDAAIDAAIAAAKGEV